MSWMGVMIYMISFFPFEWTQLHTSIQELTVEYGQWFNNWWPCRASVVFLHYWEQLLFLKLEIALLSSPLTPGSRLSENPTDHKFLRPSLTQHDKNNPFLENSVKMKTEVLKFYVLPLFFFFFWFGGG